MSADDTTTFAAAPLQDAVAGDYFPAANSNDQRKRPRGKPWKKGESGNPKGKSMSLVAIERLIGQVHTPNAPHIVGKLYTLGMDGNVQACIAFCDRTLGKVEPRKEALVTVPPINGATSEDARQFAIDALANHGASLAATSKVRELSESELKAAATIAQVTTAGLKADEELGKDSAAKMTRDQMAEQMLAQLKAWGKL